jgi:hypothetical protein
MATSEPPHLSSPLSASSLSPSSPSSHGKQSLYQIAFTQRQWKQKHGQHFAKISKEENDEEAAKQLPLQQQQQREPSSNGRKENGYQYLTPIISGANGSPGSAEQEDDADTETDSHSSLPIDLNDDSPILAIAPEKRPATSPKKEITHLSFVPKKSKTTLPKGDGAPQTAESLPPPPQPQGEDRQELHAELIREIRNGRDTPGGSQSLFICRHAAVSSSIEVNNLLVQLICSQKELKVSNWHDVLRAIQSNPEGQSAALTHLTFSRCK